MNRHTLTAILLAITAILTSNKLSHAAVISVLPRLGAVYTTAFDPLPLPPNNGFHVPNYSFPVVVQIDVYMEVESLAVGEDGFGTAAFSFGFFDGPCRCDIELSEDAGGWAAYPHPNVDFNGSAPGGIVPLFATNADLGASSQDYVGILVQMATGAFTNPNDPRRNVGEPGSPLGSPIQLGSGFFEWNGRGLGRITLGPVEVSVKRPDGIFTIALAGPTGFVDLGFCPEPSSVVMLGGMLAIAGLRRRLY
jgi:hypothetical protein